MANKRIKKKTGARAKPKTKATVAKAAAKPRIESLTPEQEADLAKYEPKWVAIGHATGPCDRPTIEAAARDCYKVAGLKPPKEIRWVQGPTEALRLIAELTKQPVQWVQPCYGQHDASWLAHYDAMRNTVGLVEETEDLQPLTRMAGAGWWWPFDDICIISERALANSLKLDEQGRLHNDKGPAIAYGDGFELWAWHGVTVDKKIILDPITSERIDGEANAEIRRILLERFGYGAYLQAGGGKVIDQGRDPSGQPVKLWRKQVPGDNEPLCILEVYDATPDAGGKRKQYLIGVPPNIEKAGDALAWTANIDAKSYFSLIEKET